jgi:hypothetical protein
LGEAGKAVYFEKERLDRERFHQEASEADQIQLEIQEERRKKVGLDEADITDGQKRGARQRQDESRDERERHKKQRKLEIEAEMDPEILEERRLAREQKKRETEERQKARAEKENAMAKQHAKLDKEQAKKATNRLEYLLKQSSIFGKLKMGGNAPKEDKKTVKKDDKKPEVHHRPATEEDEAVDSEAEDIKESHVFLTKQPTSIKFGQLKPYQLESLNWMIHLAEKGLNGILAGKVRIDSTVLTGCYCSTKLRTSSLVEQISQWVR